MRDLGACGPSGSADVALQESQRALARELRRRGVVGARWSQLKPWSAA